MECILSVAGEGRCSAHFYRNIFTVVPKGKVKEVAAMMSREESRSIAAKFSRKSAKKSGH